MNLVDYSTIFIKTLAYIILNLQDNSYRKTWQHLTKN